MERRKIQLIAGSTYTISLPKEWVRKNNLKEKNEILIFEKNDQTLVISPRSRLVESPKDITLNIDLYPGKIDQILFAVYYMGIENITVHSKKELTKETKANIRKVLTHMSGTEITYEDKQKVVIRVLLDKSRVDIPQVLYRISLLIESSITSMLEGMNIEEIKINENEIDRLYHLIAKVISLSLTDANILHTSKIKNISLVPAYFLLSKRLEHIADDINHLANYMHNKGITFSEKKEILDFINKEVMRSTRHLLSKESKIFDKPSVEQIRAISARINDVKDVSVKNYLQQIIRNLRDIEAEVMNISFYNSVLREHDL